MVSSQTSDKNAAKQTRDRIRSIRSLSSRNKRDDAIKKTKNVNRHRPLNLSQSSASEQLSLDNNKQLIVNIVRNPLVEKALMMSNICNKELRVVLKRNFGDALETPQVNPISELTVRLEKNSLIDDMVIFSAIKSTVMRTARKKRTTLTLGSLSNEQFENIIGTTTPLISPEIWPFTPSPAIVPNMPPPSFEVNTDVNSQNDIEEAAAAAAASASEQTNRRRRRHDAIVVPHKRTYRDAITMNPQQIELLCTQPHTCGSLKDLCQYCGALFFTQEKSSRSGDYSSCCNRGAYSLPSLRPCPPVLKELYTGDGPLAVQFRKRIRYINSLFAMASFKTSRPVPERRGQGHWSFAVCGQIYHFLEPIPNSQDLLRPRLNQVYFLDVEEALQRRNAFADGEDVSPALMRKIETCLRQHNKYIKAYKTMGEELKEMKEKNLEVENIVVGMTAEPVINILAAQNDPTWRPGRSDIAAVFQGSEPPIDVDLVLYPHRENDPESVNRHHELKLLNAMADPMVYPLLFPCGDNGYSTGMSYTSRAQGRIRKTVTILQYYRYRLYIRDTFSTLHHAGKLFQQFIVDGWIKNEISRLWWIRQHQNDLRTTAEETLRRFNRNRTDGHVGRAIILPSGFPGGERYRHREYMNSMAIVARMGKPDLFVTFTCNPNWPEVQNNLLPYQKWEDRPDLICRVFQTKLLAFMEDVVEKQIYGVTVHHQYAVEFQKRGLPHAHIVLTLHEDDKLRTIEDIDKIISAQIPDKDDQPLLLQRVRDFQLHAPCGKLNPNASCMWNGKCSKQYPKAYRERTAFAVGRNKIPEYKRPFDGREIFVEKWNKSITNRRVVPYNAFALAKYNSHINVEAVGSLNTIKYLHKYYSKGPDSVTIHIDNNDDNNTSTRQDPNDRRRIDEIQDYIDNRYVSAMEATWRTFQFPLHKRSHSVMFLPVHLPGERNICYNEEDDIVDVEERLMKSSKLEAWFSLNGRDFDARKYKYIEIPEHYVWNDKKGTWNKRSQKSSQFGRLQEVETTDGNVEKVFLRLLLRRMKGATSFEDLLTLENGFKCSTFRESCQKRNWLTDEGHELKKCLREAKAHYSPYKLRKLFALICCVAMEEDVGRITELWREFKKPLMADLRRNGHNRRNATELCTKLIQDVISRSRPQILLRTLLAENVEENLTSSSDEDVAIDSENSTFEYNEETNDDDDTSERRHQQREKFSILSLNSDQKRIFLRILRACSKKMNFAISSRIMEDLEADIDTDQLDDDNRENVFYLDGPGGTGKTHLYNTLIRTLEETFHQNVIAVAWTGIAANILLGGTTVHKAFKLPLTLTEESTCGFEIQSARSQFIKNAALIVWDEAPMTPRYAMETVDRFLKDIMRRFEPMGGKCVLFGGDFRQILPVVPGGRRNDVIAQSLKASTLWHSFVHLKLVKNMRVARHPETAAAYKDLHNLSFDRWLLMLGGGELPYERIDKKSAPVAPDTLIEIPKIFQVSSIRELIEFVYDNDYTTKENGNRAILCPTNAAVDSINESILQQIEATAETKTYLSEDSYAGSEEDDDDGFHVPLDLLNSLNPPSLPPHELILTRGSIVMLLRNLDVDEGECNGSRMRIIRLGDHTIECELLTGQNIGKRLILPKIKMKVQITTLPKEMIRLQFPVRLAYGMTINKSQGQTLTKVGICLRQPCFTHGQLYVAFSRVGNINGVKVYIEDSEKQGTFKFRGRKRYTSNIVFRNIVDDDDDIGSDRRIINSTRVETGDDEESDIDQDSDPNYESDQSRTDDESIFENINLEDIIGQNIVEPNNTNDDDSDFWKEAIPFRTRSQLEARVSVFDKPGTSGLNLVRRPSPPPPSQENSDYSDSD